MNQSLMKRLRKGYQGCKEPLIGNVFFNKDSDTIFNVDESNLDSSSIIEVNFGLYSFNKSIDQSWGRFRRAGLLDNMSEDEKMCSNTLFSASVKYDDINKMYYVDKDLDENKKKEIRRVFNLPEDSLIFNFI